MNPTTSNSLLNILILGSGGREHAFAWKIKQSPRCGELFIAPGNAGTRNCGTNVPVKATDFDRIHDLVLSQNINLVLVGPEEPLVLGIREYFLGHEKLRNIPVIGPGKIGAQLEGSKDFAKAFMSRHSIPTGRYQTFTKDQAGDAKKYLATLAPPYVLKADGLAAGKGVLILQDIAEAEKETEEILTNEKFGKAGNKLVIEEFLDGIELSVFVLTDGKSYKVLPAAKDYKRIGDGDTGLNTGGMGAVSPVPFAGKEFLEKVEERIIKPTITGLQKESIDYKGFIYIGLMNVNGDPFVIEYNVRMGDPETEVVMPRIASDLVDLLEGVAMENLDSRSLEISPSTAMTVMLVSGGYPGAYKTGKEITGLDAVRDALLFHAGSSFEHEKTVTSGGRVIAVTALGNSIPEVRQLVYTAVSEIKFDQSYYRNDIGLDLMRYSTAIGQD